VSRLALGPSQPPIQWLPGAFSLGVKRPGCEADSLASSAEVKECVSFTLRPLYPRKNHQYPLDRRLGGPARGSEEKNSCRESDSSRPAGSLVSILNELPTMGKPEGTSSLWRPECK
jgi:hypothetical protein